MAEIKELNSRQNKNVKKLIKLKSKKFRDKYQCFIIEGYQLITASLDTSIKLEQIFVSEKVKTSRELNSLAEQLPAKCNIYSIPEDIFAEAADTVNSQGILAVGRQRNSELNELLVGDGPLLLLAQVQDPGNAGTLIRSAAAANFTGIIALKGSVDLYNPKVVRASMGGIFMTKITRNIEMNQLKEHLPTNPVRRLIFASPEADNRYDQFKYSSGDILVIGNEAQGIPRELYQLQHKSVVIPIPGELQSLNAAMAGTVLIFTMIKDL